MSQQSPDHHTGDTSAHRGRFARAIAVLTMAVLATLGIGVGTSFADATNTGGFGPCYVKEGICIPQGTMTLTTRSVGGKGPRLSSVSAGFTFVGQLHNYWIDHNFYDSHGNRVAHIQGPQHNGQFSVGTQGWSFPRGYNAPRYGQHCATLFSWSQGKVKTWKTMCHGIG